MSDFGCLLIFRKSGGRLSDSEKETIVDTLEGTIPDSNYSFAIQSGEYTEFYEWEDDVECIRLTEYYFDGDEELYDFAKEEDLPDAEDIAQKLKKTLSEEVNIDVLFTEW